MSFFNPFVHKYKYQELVKLVDKEVVGFNGASFVSAKLNLRNKTFEFHENGMHHKWKIWEGGTGITYTTYTGENDYSFTCMLSDAGYMIDISPSRMQILNVTEKVLMVYGRIGVLERLYEKEIKALF